MKVCPITYQPIAETERYSIAGLKQLAPNLKTLSDLPFSAAEQRTEALKRAEKMSIQGVQLKLSAKLNIKEGCFEIVDTAGKFILKPQSDLYPELPQNEDVSMRLAACIGIRTPLHGLLYSSDDSFTYFIKRFDRVGHQQKIAIEDFAQLAGKTRYTKYNYSIERLIPIIESYCTFPMIEKVDLFKRLLFSYLIGNEDMHLKNFSLITQDDKIALAPAYDFLNTTIVLGSAREELALPLNGKKSRLRKTDFFDYLAEEKLKINKKVVLQVTQQIIQQYPKWVELINISFLSANMKHRYLELLEQRMKLMF